MLSERHYQTAPMTHESHTPNLSRRTLSRVEPRTVQPCAEGSTIQYKAVLTGFGDVQLTQIGADVLDEPTHTITVETFNRCYTILLDEEDD